MTRKGRIQTAFEIARIFIYGDKWHTNAAWCDRCESYVPLVTPNAAAGLDKTTPEAITARVNTGELHHLLTPEGDLLVCLGSLIDAGVSHEDELVAARKQFIYVRPAAS